jgi:hypothetical protein
MDFTKLLALLYEHGPKAVVVAVVIFVFAYMVRVLMDEDRSALWRARIYRGMYVASGRRDLEKKYIANDVNGRINFARRQLHHGETVLPVGVAVEWVEPDAEGIYDVREGEFIVRLDASAGQQRNIAKLAMTVVGRTTLLGIRHLVVPPLQRAVDLTLVRNLLHEVNDRAALDWFLQNEYMPAVTEDEIQKWNTRIVEIDDRGLFTRVLLVELDQFAKNVTGMDPRPYMTGEIESLVDFLYRIAAKELGQDVPLTLFRAHMQVAVILVARTRKLLEQGIEPYVRAVHANVGRGVSSVYVIRFDKELLRDRDEEAHSRYLHEVSQLDKEILNSSHIRKDVTFRFKCIDQQGERRHAVCTRYLVRSA